jgi:hypothetical protein
MWNYLKQKLYNLNENCFFSRICSFVGIFDFIKFYKFRIELQVGAMIDVRTKIKLY